MTNREFLTVVANAEVSAEVREFALESLAKMDARNAKRSSKPSKVALANAPLKEAILAYLTEKGSAVASAVGADLQMTTQKASALMRQMVEDGVLTVADVKIPKKGVQKSYSVKAE